MLVKCYPKWKAINGSSEESGEFIDLCGVTSQCKSKNVPEDSEKKKSETVWNITHKNSTENAGGGIFAPSLCCVFNLCFLFSVLS